MFIQTAAPADSIALPTPEQIAEIDILLGSIPETALYVAMSIGLLLYVIGWFGGTKYTRNKVLSCIIVTVLVCVFSSPIVFWFFKVLLSAGANAALAFAIVYVLWASFMIGMAISLYETFIVTAEEGRPN